MRARLVTFLATLLLGTSLFAQMARGPMRISASSGFGAAQHAHPRTLILGSAFWGDSYPPYPPSPQVIVVQPQPQIPDRSSAPIEEHKSAAPLLIEWQGDRYVRRTSESNSNSRASQPDYVSNTPQPIGSRRSQPEPPPTTFIFRDGHREHSSDYSIISGVIYTRGDYWNPGESSKQIPLTQLDLPATLKANQQQGAPFRLPRAPNEVITRP